MIAPASPPDIVLVHSSDLHVDDGYTARAWGGDGTAPLAAVLDAARIVRADIVVLAGDVFEHNRLNADILDRTRALLASAGRPVVLLPGNHDPLTRESVWRRGRLDEVAGAHVLGPDDRPLAFPAFDLEVWGRAHADYDDMTPLAAPPARRARRHVIAAHGHYVAARPEGDGPAPAWLITDDDLAATAADYVALGHWNEHVAVGSGAVRAVYSGSPDYAGTVNVVTFGADGAVTVRRAPVPGVPA